ncbi:hypothetical protein H0N96_03140 [Candidatus Micrarchaeota archaeon]|nr:hypothetical protein [Candidatus Micrarchaeota archaeon]
MVFSSRQRVEELKLLHPLPFKSVKSIFGPSPPNVFVGHGSYPNVLAGPLVGFDEAVDAELCDSPGKWFGRPYSELIGFRSSLARGANRQNVKRPGRFFAEIQDTALSEKPVDLEVEFTKPLRGEVTFSQWVQPMGPAGEVEALRVVGNPSIPKKIDSIVEEKLLVREALPELVGAGFDFYYLQKLLSAGILGKEKKLVPTKWGITATDKMLADFFLDDVRRFPELNEFRVYSSEFLYNRFEILLVPGKWEFEQFEAWSSPEAASAWGSLAFEYEPFGGRSDYAESESGGYYAGRFGVVEALRKLKRQARVVVFREIGADYTVPLGVWQVRQNVRNAFEQEPRKFGSMFEALKFLKTRLRTPLSSYLKKSIVLNQKKIFEF